MKLIPIAGEPEDAETRAVFERIAASRGWVSNAMRALSAAPEGLKVFSAVGHYGRYGTALSEIQRELTILIVARSVPYAWAHHVPLGLQAGLTFVAAYGGNAGEVRYAANLMGGTLGRLYVDLTGNGASDFSIDLTGAPALTAADLIL